MIGQLTQDDTITIINALELTKKIVYTDPLVELIKNAHTLSVERIDHVIDNLTIKRNNDETAARN